MTREFSYCPPGRRAGRGILRILFFSLTLGLLPAAGGLAQEPPTVDARYAWAGTTGNTDGTYAVTFDITLTNTGWDDLYNLSIELVDAVPLPCIPHESALAAGTLYAGESVHLLWTVTALSDLPPDIADRAVLIMAGQAEDGLGNPIGVAVSDMGAGQ